MHNRVLVPAPTIPAVPCRSQGQVKVQLLLEHWPGTHPASGSLFHYKKALMVRIAHPHVHRAATLWKPYSLCLVAWNKPTKLQKQKTQGWGNSTVSKVPTKHRGLECDTDNPYKKPGVMAQTCNSSTEDAGKSRSLGLTGQLALPTGSTPSQ